MFSHVFKAFAFKPGGTVRCISGIFPAQNLVKTLAKNLIKNLAKHLAEKLSDRLTENSAKNMWGRPINCPDGGDKFFSFCFFFFARPSYTRENSSEPFFNFSLLRVSLLFW